MSIYNHTDYDNAEKIERSFSGQEQQVSLKSHLYCIWHHIVMSLYPDILMLSSLGHYISMFTKMNKTFNVTIMRYVKVPGIDSFYRQTYFEEINQKAK